MKRNIGPCDMFFPVPAALIVSGEGEQANIATYPGSDLLSSEPPTIGISLRNDRYTLQLIRKGHEFSVNIPSEDLSIQVDYCGIISGRDANKFEATGFKTDASLYIRPPLIRDCPYNLECVVVGEEEIGDFVLVMGKIVANHIDENLLSPEGKVEMGAVRPLVTAPTPGLLELGCNWTMQYTVGLLLDMLNRRVRNKHD
jgi:flavin reductase (DIM6/NTAB) family NADH-FMN oxidoreductase RutF